MLVMDTTHPFGCESATSLQDLFEYFKRCLQHGEWELASACVPQLVSSPGGPPDKLHDIIKAIICHPYNLKWVSYSPDCCVFCGVLVELFIQMLFL